MVSPLLIIGAGGAGGKTLRAIKQTLQENLLAAGYEGGIPRAWQFLHFDTTPQQDGHDFGLPLLSPEEFFSLGPAGVHFQHIQKFIDSLGSNTELQEMLAGWSSPRQIVQVNKSPSTRRVHGRESFIAQLPAVRDSVSNCIATLHAVESLPELKELAKNIEMKLVDPNPQVFIFSSLCGGTGSGIFLDIAELLKSLVPATWAHQSVSFLYGPDVFECFQRGLQGSISANALGALNELIASDSGGLSIGSHVLYSKFGINSQCRDLGSNWYGPCLDVFVGARNFTNNGNYIDANDVFLNYGKALANAISEDKIADFLGSQIEELETKYDGINYLSGLTPPTIRTRHYSESISSPIPAWVHDSLTEPILNQITKSKKSREIWESFWEGRRSRPLIESIPMPPEIREAIIAGWFVAGILGLREIGVNEMGPTVKIWNPTLQNPGFSSFPDPLFPSHPEDETRGSWLLPSVLTSLGIALCNFGKSGAIEHVEPYSLLQYLGQEVTLPNQSNIHWRLPNAVGVIPNGQNAHSKMLSEWVLEGIKPSDRELLNLLTAQLKTFDTRKGALIATLDKLIDQYARAWDELSRSPWQELPESWEIKEEINSALRGIHQYVTGL